MNVALQPKPDGVQALLQRVDYRLAETREQKDDIYRLRYRAYLREGVVAPSETGMTVDQYDDCPSSWIFGVYIDGVLCSSIRISVLTREWRKSPSADLFADVLAPLLDAGHVLVDPTRFVADPEKASRYPKLPLMTTRLALLACEHFNADLGLAIVRPEHYRFYGRLFMHEPMAQPRLFPGLLKPVGLMGARYRESRDEVLRRSPFLRSSAFERRMLFKDCEARMGVGAPPQGAGPRRPTSVLASTAAPAPAAAPPSVSGRS